MLKCCADCDHFAITRPMVIRGVMDCDPEEGECRFEDEFVEPEELEEDDYRATGDANTCPLYRKR